MPSKVWFVTGTSRGFGRVWAEAALARGDRVAATGFGIKVTIVEPGGFATDWGGTSAKRATPMGIYDGARAAIAALRSSSRPGDPHATGPAILKVVDAKDPPLRIFFGSSGLAMTRAEYARRIETWEKWSEVSMEAQGNLPAKG
jgi:NAD(P)-dependent dehydrogenase (short-subunit alcohol dehydrogenase family)